jgi:hypothetical protein
MSRSLNSAANPLRILLLLLALALLGMIVVGFKATPTPLYNTGSHLTGPSGPATNLSSQPPANTMGNQAAPAAPTRVIGPASQQPAYVPPAGSSVPAQAAPYQGQPVAPAAQGCANVPPGRAIAACSNP